MRRRAPSPRPIGLPSHVRWPLPPPGRPRHAWLLRCGIRRWQLRRLLRRTLPFVRSSRCLIDLGAGNAADADELLRLLPRDLTRRTVLLDAQLPMLAQIPRIGPEDAPGGRVARLLGDVARLPFPSGSADLVLSVGTLCCVAEPAVPAAIRETTRILRPGGLLVLAVPRWRGVADEAATAATGLVRLDRGRAGRGVFQKPL